MTGGAAWTGTAADSITAAMWLPQVIRTVRTRSAVDFSWITLIGTLAGLGIWLWFETQLHTWAMVATTAVSAAGTITVLIVKTRTPPPRRPQGAAIMHEDLLTEAAEFVITRQYGSQNAMQRTLRIGFAKAGQLMDQLEDLGIVGPHRGAAPRDVLVPASGLQTALDKIRGVRA